MKAKKMSESSPKIKKAKRTGSTALNTFIRRWYQRNRNSHISPRFVVPPRLNSLFTVGLKPETVEHFQTFGFGNSSTGREEEAASLYETVAYEAVIKKTLRESVKRLVDLNVVEVIPHEIQGKVSEILEEISNAQLAVFGTYEVNASRYEVLCGRQDASGFADSDLLEA